ncbi:MAG: transposase [Acidobacteriota bacterium]
MRHARLTWQGAFHHVMNRGIEKIPVFKDDKLKGSYIEFLEKYSKRDKIRIFAYCIMDNHFHLALENSSLKMSEFMKNVNSDFGQLYRKLNGGKGYVFEDRFKSTLVENESYLLNLIRYILQNPVRAKIVSDPFQYHWSSINLYYKEKKSELINIEFVEDIFGQKNNFMNLLNDIIYDDLSEKKTKFGKVFGSEDFVEYSENKYERRSDNISKLNKRESDKYFEPVDKIIYEFENRIGKKIEKIDISTHIGKRERGELLVYLKDYSGLKYREICEFDIFRDIKFNSLGHLYSNTKKHLKK